MKTRWERFEAVQHELQVARRTLRSWCDLGYVQHRREGPKLIFILVHAEGPAAGRPVGLDEQPAAEEPTT